MQKFTNNFDFARLLAALFVLYGHQYGLLGHNEPTLMPGQSFGTIGVYIFFSISGYLVVQSWQRDSRILPFVAKRLLRIWPGLIVATLFCAIVLGPLVSTLPLTEYFLSPDLRTYLTTARFKIVYFLPGVFETNPYPRAVNGSLWTIPFELRCYLALMLAGVCGLFRFRIPSLVVTCILAIYCFTTPEAWDNYNLRLGLFFATGVCLHLFSEWKQNKWLAMILLLATGGALLKDQPNLAAWLLIPFLSIAIGSMSTPVLRRAGRFGDLSYGIYIYAFPVQQFFIWLTQKNPLHFGWYFTITFFSVILFALLSWHIVEQPALKLKPRGRQPNAEEMASATPLI